MANFETTPPVTTDCKPAVEAHAAGAPLGLRRVAPRCRLERNAVLDRWQAITRVQKRAPPPTPAAATISAASGWRRRGSTVFTWDSSGTGYRQRPDLWIDDVALSRQRVGCPARQRRRRMRSMKFLAGRRGERRHDGRAGGRAGGQRRGRRRPRRAAPHGRGAAAHRAGRHRCRAQEPGRQPARSSASPALVYQRGKEVYFGAFGLADRENNKPMARDTIVQIFSMTKPVTGVALMKLYERGKFQLDDPLEATLPEFANRQGVCGPRRSGPAEVRGAEAQADHSRRAAPHGRFHGGESTIRRAVGAIYREANPRAVRQHAARSSRRSSRRCRWPINRARAGCIRTPSTCRPRWCRKSPACRSTSSSSCTSSSRWA